MNAPRSKDSRQSKVNLEKFFHYKSSTPDENALFYRDEFVAALNESQGSSLPGDIYMAINNPPKNAFKQMNLYKSILMRAGLRLLLLEDMVENLLKENDRMGAGIGDQGRKRWTQEEDELLIEAASDGTKTIIDLSKAFGRTPGAIQSRITKLVGIKRLSEEIAGRFMGTINGEFIEGEIDGTLRKG